ncbi:hypothetical protein Bca52824_085940 [Brassica carinata]|uniref:Agenet domain-containing protein n=1 Tax=Brassica carinata TaxID=52824 RepID=A0A8X7P973_BRACI|nr:hypothetical protein Bca52824_085940 [Brassica carinata]
MSQQPNLTHEETMIESAASPKSQQNEDYTQPLSEAPLSPMSQQPNLTHEVEVSRLLAHFQIGAEVEILSTNDEIWYPGKVVDLKLCEGLEELTVEYTTLFADQHRLETWGYYHG